MNMTPGLLAVDYEERISFARLRQARYERTLSMMTKHGLDAMVLTKPFNSKYVLGERQMFIAGRRGYAHCVVPANPTMSPERRPFLFITDADGAPPELPDGHSFVRYRNTVELARKTAELLGESVRGTIGVDEWSVGLHQRLVEAMPQARWGDANVVLDEAKREKLPDEIRCLRLAAAICEAAMHRAVRALRAGLTEKEVAGAFMARCAELGFTVFPNEIAVASWPRMAVSGAAAFRPVSRDRLLQPDDLVLLNGSVAYMGYQAELTRTWRITGDGEAKPEERSLHERWQRVMNAVLAECRPGRTAGDLARAAQALEPLPPDYLVRGIGLTVEPPFAGTTLGPAAEDVWVLAANMTLVVSPLIWIDGVGGYRASQTVQVTQSAPEILSAFDYGPLAETV